LGGAQINNYWGRSSFIESAFYVGLFPFLLAVIGALKRRRWFFLALLLLAAAFACGAYTPLFKAYKILPPFSLFRAPGRLLLYATFALAVAAGDGLDYFVASRSRAFASTALAVMLGAAAVVLAFRFTLPQLKAAVEKRGAAKAEVVAASYGNADAVREYYAARSEVLFRKAASAARLRNRATWFQFGMLGAAVVIFWGARRNRAVAVAAPCVVIALTAVDLYRYAYGLNPTVRASLVNRPPPAAAAIGPLNGARIYSSGFSLGPNKQLGLGLIHENTHAIWGYDLLVPRASLRPATAVAVFEELEDLYTTAPDPGGRRFARPMVPPTKLFRTYGIKYYVRLNPWFGEGAACTARVPPYFVYEDVAAMPRARAVSGYRLAQNDADALDIVQSDAFDAARQAVLFEKAEGLGPSPAPSAAVDVARATPLAVRCRVNGPSLLLLDELYYPGWEARVGGRAAKIYRANVISRAVVVPPGRHDVTFRFKPSSFALGLVTSLVSWCGVLAAAAAITLRRRKPRNA